MINYVTTQDLHIAYLEQGNKDDPTILLLHGWPDDATAWNGVMPKLVQMGYRVIAPWYRGFGTTNFLKKDIPRTGNSGIIAHDTIEFMNTLEIKNFSVVGHDWGSNVAEYLAVGWPDRIKQITFMCYKPRLGGITTPSFKQARLQWHHWFMAAKRGKEAVRKDPIGFARVMWETWAPKDWFDEQTFQQVAQSWLNPDFVDVTLHAYNSCWEETEPDEKSKSLEEKVKSTQTLSLPTLLIHGEMDGVGSPYNSENIHEKFPGPFNRIVLPGVGHFPAREAPDEVSAHIIAFFKEDFNIN